MKKTMYIIASLIVLLIITTVVIINQAQFGKLPSGERLARIKTSHNYENGAFKNLSDTPVMSEDASTWEMLKEFFFGDKSKLTPIDSLPSVKTNLFKLNRNQDLLIWFGHSSYYMQLHGKRILVDPVFSGHASPFSFSIKAFKGSNVYTANDIPDIDYLFITHDHWDHLDYETIIQLRSKINKVICGLGVGAHFEYWGFLKNQIIELDWNERAGIGKDISASAMPARHFSGRGFTRNKSLWVSFVITTPSKNIFIGGDGGYDTHFADIAKKFGKMDLAILENGQYDKNWKHIHLLPEDLLKVIADLKPKKVLAVHSSKFALANHTWKEPLEKIALASKEHNIPLITPMIGEVVYLDNDEQKFKEWWKDLR